MYFWLILEKDLLIPDLSATWNFRFGQNVTKLWVFEKKSPAMPKIQNLSELGTNKLLVNAQIKFLLAVC